MAKKQVKDFKLLKLKLITGGGIDVHYTHVEVDGSDQYEMKGHEESPKIPHKDLTDLLNDMRGMVARVFALTFFREIIVNPDFGATDDQSKYSERYYQAILDKIKITGVALSGIESDKTKGCIITSTFRSEVNVPMALNTHRIKFHNTTYGFEESLGNLCDELQEEVYKYLFENKKGQLDLFPQGEGDADEKQD